MTGDDPNGLSAATSRPFAWQPLTPRGTAAFAHATLGRLLLVEFLIASLAAGAVVWCLANAWFPAIRQAIQQLPEQGAIHHRALDSPINLAQTLAENRFILFVLDVDDLRNPSSTPDVVVEFHKSNFQVCSILGCLAFDYPKGASVEFNRPKLAPLWGAWEAPLLGMAALGVIVLLFVGWVLLATLYCFVVRLLGFFKDRDLNWRRSWQLASAALMPGALLLAAGIFCYGLGKLGLIRLLFLFLLHFVMGWIYVAISPLFVPRLSTLLPRGANPFAPSGPESLEKPGPNTDQHRPG